MAGIIEGNKVSGVITESMLHDDSLFRDIAEQSAVFARGRNIGAMPKGTTSIPVPETLLSAGFVGQGKQKPVTDASINVPKLKAGKIAAIALVPIEVIEDADIDIWEQWLKPQVPGAFGAALDGAALFGNGKPEEWTGFQSGLVPQAIAAGNGVTMAGDLYQEILGVNGMEHKVNADGFPVNGWIGDSEIEAELRGLVDKNGRPLYQPFLNPITGKAERAINGMPYYAVLNGSWYDTVNNAQLIGGDFNKLIYSIRKEIEYKISTDATVTLPNGDIVNCFQNNLVAFLMEMRVAAAVLNPVTRKNPDSAKRFPFAVLTRNADIKLRDLTVNSEAGSTAGATLVSVDTPLPTGHSYKYKAGDTAEPVTYDQVLTTGWTALPADGIVSGLTKGQTLTVAEVNADNKAKAVGTATVIVK